MDWFRKTPKEPPEERPRFMLETLTPEVIMVRALKLGSKSFARALEEIGKNFVVKSITGLNDTGGSFTCTSALLVIVEPRTKLTE